MKSRSLIAVGAAIAALVAVVASAQAPESVVVSTPDGRTLDWSRWLGSSGPVAVLVWSSWAPRGGEALAEAERLSALCRERSLGFVVVAVQEPLEDSARALGKAKWRWLHDRHGAVLKRHRVVRVPALVVLAADGRVLARLGPTADALRAWDGP